jgi:hypothetical protein
MRYLNVNDETYHNMHIPDVPKRNYTKFQYMTPDGVVVNFTPAKHKKAQHYILNFGVMPFSYNGKQLSFQRKVTIQK